MGDKQELLDELDRQIRNCQVSVFINAVLVIFGLILICTIIFAFFGTIFLIIGLIGASSNRRKLEDLKLERLKNGR